MIHTFFRRHAGSGLLAAALALTTAIYWPGLHGGWLFDDYPNIVDNKGVQPAGISLASLVNAALSSPASEFKRPLASLSFAANYLATGLDPYWMKLTNLLIHLLNGLLVFVLARALLDAAATITDNTSTPGEPTSLARLQERRIGIVAALIAASWMLLPINLTGVLYVVQRMESMANVFVLSGLIGYIAGRQCMFASRRRSSTPSIRQAASLLDRGFLLCLGSITVPAMFGLLAKETAVMLPLYAAMIEWMVFRFRAAPAAPRETNVDPTKRPESLAAGHEAMAPEPAGPTRDWRVFALFLLALALPMVVGLAWLVPGILNPEAWATRDFTLGTRLLSEARIVVDYIAWTLLPLPQELSFYHDDFVVSSSLLAPWTTLASILALVGLLALMVRLRRRQPLAALGIALFLGCHLLTGTILPLELIYEHRNYFASFGLMLAVVPLLVAAATPAPSVVLPRRALLACLLLWWTASTAITVHAWGNPLSLAQELAERGPDSPRAQYELGRTDIIYSHYDPNSPFTRAAYAPLERAAALPKSSILPQQALIYMNARMGLPLKDAWWDSMIAKLRAHPPGVQDESSLITLTQCAREHRCILPHQRMVDAFTAALSHPAPSARLLASYGDYAWYVLDNKTLGEQLTAQAVQAQPDEAAYRIRLIRMLAAQGRMQEAGRAMRQLESMNYGGRLDDALPGLRTLINR